MGHEGNSVAENTALACASPAGRAAPALTRRARLRPGVQEMSLLPGVASASRVGQWHPSPLNSPVPAPGASVP